MRRYNDWIDVSGHAREYAYVDVDFLAIIAGVANASQVRTCWNAIVRYPKKNMYLFRGPAYPFISLHLL